MKPVYIPLMALLLMLIPSGVQAMDEDGIDTETGEALHQLLMSGFSAETLDALGELGLEPVDTVPWLIDVIDNEEDRFTRISACNAIALIGPDAADAVGVLIEILRFREFLGDWWLLKSAIEALGAIGSPAADDAGPLIYEILIENRDYEDLARIPRKPSGDRAYPTGDREVFWAAYRAMVDNGRHPMPLLINELRSPYMSNEAWDRKRAVFDVIEHIGRDAVPFMNAVFEDESAGYDVLNNCVMCFTELGSNGSGTVGSLIELYNRLDAMHFEREYLKSGLYMNIVSAFGSIGPGAEEAVPLLIDLATDEDVDLASRAVASLWRIGDERAIPVIIEALDDDREIETQTVREGKLTFEMRAQVKWNALWAIREFGPRAKDAVPKLVEMLADEDENTGFTLYAALGSIGADAVPLTCQALLSDDPLVRENAARALGYAKSEAAGAVDVLVTMLRKEKSSEVRKAIASTIGRIGRDALDYCVENPIGALIDLLDDDSWEVRENAARSLGMFGADAEAALPGLEKLEVNDPYVDEKYERYFVRETATDAIERIETDWRPKPGLTGPRPLCPG